MRMATVVLLLGAMSFAQQPAGTSDDHAPAASNSVTIAAGTRIPLSLKNAVSTKSARPGDPVYLVTTFPITENDAMLIPAGTYVQGVITSITRPGRVKGRAELLMHFTTMIFPNGYTVSLPGAVDSLPGADDSKIKDKEGTVQHSGEKGHDTATVAGTGATGAMIGAAAGGGKGALLGAAAGGATGLAIAMLTRGSDVRFEAGTTIEMVLQRPLTLQESRLHRSGRNFVPVKPMDSLTRPALEPVPDPR